MPDAGMAAYQMGRQHRVILACEKWWPLTGPHNLPNSSDCSGFVQSVARELRITLGGSANAIFRTIQSKPWSPLGFGDHAAELAAVAATNGLFVIGAWQNPNPHGNGHVGVIVDTNYSDAVAPHRAYARSFWGTLNSVGQQYGKHSESWGRDKRPHVLYASIPIGDQ